MTRENPHSALLSPSFLRMLQSLSLRMEGKVRGQTQAGARRSVRRGSGGDFLDVRPYTAGDDLRHLDWHLFARLDTLLVRLYEQPQEHTLHLLLDSSASMDCGRGLFARRLVAALAYLGLVGGDRVGLVTLSDQVQSSLGPLRGRNAAHRVFDTLGKLSFEGQGDMHRALMHFGKVRRRGTLVVVSDFLMPGGVAEALAQMARTGCQGAVLHLLSPEERMPTLGDDHTFIDAETGAQMVVHVTARVRQAYLDRLAALEDELRQACKRYKFAFVPVSSGDALEDVLLGPLRRQGLVGG